MIVSCMLLCAYQKTLKVQAYHPDMVNKRLIQTTTPMEEYEGLLFLGLLETDLLTEENVDETVKNVSDSIVKIYVNGYVGSGVIFDVTKDYLMIVSNKHLLMYDVVGEIAVDDSSLLQGNVIGVSDQYDVGFISVSSNQLTTKEQDSIKKVNREQQKYDELNIGSTIIQIGSTDGVASNVYSGTVVNTWEFIGELNSFMLHNRCYAKPGMSGGGVFDGYGNFMGIITAGKKDQTVCLPLSIITSEYENIIKKVQ